jgi:hypothetical protein
LALRDSDEAIVDNRAGQIAREKLIAQMICATSFFLAG